MPFGPADIATRNQVYLERLKAGLVRDYNRAQASLRSRIREIMQTLEVDTLDQLSRHKLAVLCQRLKDAHLGVTFEAMNQFMDQLPDIALLSAGLEVNNLMAAIAGGPKFAMPTAKLAYEAALANPIQATGELLEPFISTWRGGEAVRFSNVVRTGWGQGKTLQQMIREIVGTKANGYADGILDMTRRNAGTVIHTATQHVSQQARQVVWENNNDIVTGYQWVSTLDRRTTTKCRSLDGRVFEPGKGPLPPIHPNCRSTTIAALGPEWDWLDEGATRASSGPNAGYVPADETYYGWLKKQPAEFQNVAIGPVRGKLLRDGGLNADEFSRLNLGRDFEPLTLYGEGGMQDLEPEAFKRAGIYRQK